MILNLVCHKINYLLFLKFNSVFLILKVFFGVALIESNFDQFIAGDFVCRLNEAPYPHRETLVFQGFHGILRLHRLLESCVVLELNVWRTKCQDQEER